MVREEEQKEEREREREREREGGHLVFATSTLK